MLGQIIRERMGKIKKRMILNCKRSRVSKAARAGYRVILPRLIDIVFQTLGLMSDLEL